jgi:hypothetical protein
MSKGCGPIWQGQMFAFLPRCLFALLPCCPVALLPCFLFVLFPFALFPFCLVARSDSFLQPYKANLP